MSRILISLLGPLSLNIEDQPFAFAASPIALLLGYLALHATQGHAVARSTLAGKLWPNLSDRRARHTLNDTLYRLRRTVADTSWLCADSTTIRLVNVSVDVDRFKAAVVSACLEDWQRALELYRGDLLEELDADWVLIPRVSLRDQFLHMLTQVCAALTSSGRIGNALAYARHWALVDPFNEDAHRTVMRLAARLGQSIVALQQYDHLVQLLDEEFQTAPLPATRALANAIRTEAYTVFNTAPVLPTLVGRKAERSILLHHAEQAQQGHGRLILLEGKAGVGKTRLLEALAEGAAWRGMHVAWSRGCAGAVPYDYAPLNEAIGAAASDEQIDQLCSRLAPDAVELLRELADGQFSRSAHAPAISKLAPEDICAAYDDILQAISEAHACLLILDDMQCASAHTWLALQACALRLQHRRLLIVLSYRGAELRASPPAWRALRCLDRELAPLRLVLQELSPKERDKPAHLSSATLDSGVPLELRQRASASTQPTNGKCISCIAHKPEVLHERAVAAPAPQSVDRPALLSLAVQQDAAESAQADPRQACPTCVHIHLARAGAPLGRPLSAEERVLVRWNVDAGEADRQLLQREGKVALRHHRILRLIAEAQEQGGRPTDVDLARALKVTERTIVADMAALHANGHSPATRRRTTG